MVAATAAASVCAAATSAACAAVSACCGLLLERPPLRSFAVQNHSRMENSMHLSLASFAVTHTDPAVVGNKILRHRSHWTLPRIR